MISTVARSGIGIGLLGIAGNSVGILVHAGVAAAGLTTLLVASPDVMHFLGVAGGCYLIFLGISYIRSKLRTATDIETTDQSGKNAFVSGILINLLNPKVPVLMLAMLPQVAGESASQSGIQFFLTGTLHALIAACVLTTVALFVTSLQGNPESRRSSRRLQQACGGVMIVAGGVMVGSALTHIV